MFETATLLSAAKWIGIATIASALFAMIAFFLKWGFRFRLVGITGFMAVLTGSIFALGLGLYSRPSIPGTVPYSLVYDTGGAETVIAVAPSVTPTQLEATLQQASLDLRSPGRLSQGQDRMIIRVRTILHPQPGISQPLYLGEAQRLFSDRPDSQATIALYPGQLAQLPQPAA